MWAKTCAAAHYFNTISAYVYGLYASKAFDHAVILAGSCLQKDIAVFMKHCYNAVLICKARTCR